MSSSSDILPNDFPEAVNKVVYDEQTISRRVGELADQIGPDMAGRTSSWWVFSRGPTCSLTT